MEYRLLYAALYIGLGLIPRDQLQQLESLFMASHKYPPLSKLVNAFTRELDNCNRELILEKWRWLCRDSSDKLLRRYLLQHDGDLLKVMKMIAQSIVFQLREFDSCKLLSRGEQYYIRTEPDPHFIAQYRSRKLSVVGRDREGRPVVDVWPKHHWPSMQSREAAKRMYALAMETAYLSQTDDVDGVLLLFDLSEWKLQHTDYSLLKFITDINSVAMPVIHKIVLHNPPAFFTPAWTIIKQWFEPWFVKKVEFTQGIDDLLKYVTLSQLPRHYGGRLRYDCGQWTTPRPEEDRLMTSSDKETVKLRFENAVREYENAVCHFISKGDAAEKQVLGEKLARAFWVLDPYVRSRSVWDRHGVLGTLRPELAEGGIAQPSLKPLMPTYKPSIPIVNFCKPLPEQLSSVY